MGQTRVHRTIEAAPEVVFDAVAHIENFSKIVPDITNVEFLSENKTGVGARFRETRLMRGKDVSTELEVTEYHAPHRVRMVSDEGGTIWDTLFTVTPSGSGSELEVVMDSRPYKLMAKLVNPFLGRFLSKAVSADMDAVKAHCEGA